LQVWRWLWVKLVRQTHPSKEIFEIWRWLETIVREFAPSRSPQQENKFYVLSAIGTAVAKLDCVPELDRLRYRSTAMRAAIASARITAPIGTTRTNKIDIVFILPLPLLRL
jgi:hypothetical protein